MHKLLIGSLALMLLISPCAHAAAGDGANEKDAITQPEDAAPDIDASDLSTGVTGDEKPPRPEPPYPGSEQSDFAADQGMKKTARAPEPPPEPPADLERPKKIDEDGNYIYGTDVKPPKPSGNPELMPPMKTFESGAYLYDSPGATPTFQGGLGHEKPIEISAHGEYRYRLPENRSKGSSSFRLGSMTPPNIKNTDNGVTFSDLYGSSPAPLLMGDYEYRLTSRIGRLALKFTSGLMVASGQGRFRNTNPDRPADVLPDEKYTFVLFPNQLTMQYKFQYAEKQIFVPYVEGGGGYFIFGEIRDDGKRPKGGGSPVGVAAGGVNFLLDWLDPHAIRQLDADYGINHVWLTAEFRQFVGLESATDFTSNSINAGFIMEF